MLISEKRIEANRANSHKSTGPRTIEGKARSSHNALTHGLTSQSSTLLPNENEATYQAFLQDLFAEHNPQTPTQRLLVQRIADLLWRLQRLASAESHLFLLINQRQNEAIESRNQKRQKDYQNLPFRDRSQTPPPTPGEPQPLDPAHILAQHFLEHDDKTNPFTRLQRYESTLQRSLEKVLHQLRTLKKEYETNPPPVACSPEGEDEREGSAHINSNPETQNEPTPADRSLGDQAPPTDAKTSNGHEGAASTAFRGPNNAPQTSHPGP